MTIISPQPLRGRAALITGASSGIGAATAELLAARGATVALLARRKDRLDELTARITAAGGTALAVPVDVTDTTALGAAVSRAAAELGGLDLVVNNAGIMLPAPIEELRADQWQHQIDLNVTAAVHTAGAVTPLLVAAAAEGRTADLFTTSSIAAQNIFPTFAVYSATKAFITHLSRHLRVELGAKDVRVSAIEPGIVGTELQSHVTDQGARDWLAGAAEQVEFLTPQDVAEVIAFAAALPRRVNLQQVTIMPTRQPS
ncbi:oxidoreductase [Actinoplanes philippinensis]|uniref:NADP-dependent 3-hydroxy acid dehydrogenase YdfG n=1 Tax=Actinoplanes philippinensis TaxID=35752 RepID=A0A1I2N8J2_9ACTN|nr:SDR family oxidoreductase [Actinoplanes philippinensis]GIE83495.1 oxidoreductase [Actinoplanes philippinensis]SFF99883.1 NADP-dependent 3-hydroxy acid dehydrogenase YdfG [Actinoplanes philippinensis]